MVFYSSTLEVEVFHNIRFSSHFLLHLKAYEYVNHYNMPDFPHFNPLIPMSDQDRIIPYNIKTISNRQVMRIKKNIS